MEAGDVRFDRESWRKLYVAESIEHRLLPLFARGLRDYLLRLAEDDGTLLRSTKDPAGDLFRVLNALPRERKQVTEAVTELQRIGYLNYSDGRLWIAKFHEAQTARSKNAVRQARFKERHRAARDNATEPVTDNEPGNADEALPVTLQKDETRRDETRTPKPPPGAVPQSPSPGNLDDALKIPVTQRAKILERDPHKAQWLEPQRWPEVLVVAEVWGDARLSAYHRDTGVKNVVALFAAGYSPAELVRVSQTIQASAWARDQRSKGKRIGLACLTPEVVRRELSGATETTPEAVVTP
jgi:hypothetical protein